MKLNYGEALKQQRQLNGYTQERLAKETGIVQPNISAWENNIYTPSIDFLVQLADFYGITLDELVGRDSRTGSNSKYSIGSINNNGGSVNMK